MQDRKKSIKLFNIKSIVRWLQVNDYFYQLTSDLLAIEKEITKNIRRFGGQYVSRLVEGCLGAGKILQKRSVFLGKMAEFFTTKEEIIRAILEYEKVVLDYTVYYQITFFEDPVMRLSQEMVNKYVKGDKLACQQLLDLITISYRLTEAEKEQDDFLRIAIRDKNRRKELVEKHAKKYGWLSIRYFIGDAWTAKDVLGRLRGISKKEAEIQLRNKLVIREQNKKMISQTIAGFNIEDRRIIKQVRQLVFLRTQRVDFLNETAYHIRPLLNRIARELGVVYNDLLHLNIREIALALRGEINYLELIKRRKSNFIIYYDIGGREILSGLEVPRFLKSHSFLKNKIRKAANFVGQVGYYGKTQGVVRLLKKNADVAKVKRGDIVVTNMTTLNYLPALEKAVAFVTDEGGITCHAAIIAREMKKPCIIGTKIATKVLHDGDYIEVDANNGVVTIMKSGNK